VEFVCCALLTVTTFESVAGDGEIGDFGLGSALLLALGCGATVGSEWPSRTTHQEQRTSIQPIILIAIEQLLNQLIIKTLIHSTPIFNAFDAKSLLAQAA
jgi:hypothetical protein